MHKQRHALLDIGLLTVCTVVTRANGWKAVEEFGREKRGWLGCLALFESMVPSDDCIANVIARLAPEGFGAWSRGRTPAPAGGTGGEIITVDGKSAPGSWDRRRGRSALHLVNGWTSHMREDHGVWNDDYDEKVVLGA